MRPLTRIKPLRALPRAFSRPPPRPLFQPQDVRRRFHLSRTFKEQQEDGAASMQTVKIHRPIFSWRRIMFLAAYGAGTYYIVSFFMAQLSEKLGLNEEDFEEDALEGDEEDDDSVFIAFRPPSKLPRTFYKQSDPEWQEFIKISNDEAKKEAVRDELAQRVAKDISAHPRIRMRLGGNISLTKFWLELKYPDAPPAEYARQGIEIAPEYIAWSTQVIPQAHYDQLRQILYPRAVFTALLNSLRILGRLQTIKVKEALGVSLNPKDKQVQAVSRLEQTRRTLLEKKLQLEAQRNDTAAERKQLERRLSQSNSSQTSPTGDASTSTTAPSKSVLGTPAATTPTSSSAFPSRDLLPTPPRLPTDLAIAWKMFAGTLVHSWFRGRMDHEPRGSFIVVGQVEVTGDKGKVNCDVKAAYDPKEAKYLYVKTTVRHFWELRQSAKGGP